MRLAHLTDLHLPIVERPRVRELLGKRALGYLSWRRNRRFRHTLPALQAVANDCRRARPDVTVISGDLVNISLKSEFSQAVQWLENNFDARNIAFAPGNHDAYVRLPWSDGTGRFEQFMVGARAADSTLRPPEGPDDFPYVHTLGRVSLVIANSSPPTAPGLATGRIGAAQLGRLRTELMRLKDLGHCRVLVLHHPVTSGATPRRKALEDAAALRSVLEMTGAELVLHGHTHAAVWASVSTPFGARPVVGGGSASHPKADGKYRPARYNLFAIEEDAGGGWRIDVEVRELDPESGAVKTVEERRLLPVST